MSMMDAGQPDEPQALPDAPEIGPSGAEQEIGEAPDDELLEDAIQWTLRALARTGQLIVASTDGRVLREGGQGAQGLAMAWATLTGQTAKPQPAPGGPEKVPTTDAAVGMAHQAMVDHAQRDPAGFADAVANDPSYVSDLLSGAQAHLGDLEAAGAPQDAGAAPSDGS